MNTPNTRLWTDIRRERHEQGRVDPEAVARRRKQIQAEQRAYRLAEVRKQRALTQRQIAEGMNVSQARVSNIERGQLARTELGTLQDYVQALGGSLKVVATFDDETLVVAD